MPIPTIITDSAHLVSATIDTLTIDSLKVDSIIVDTLKALVVPPSGFIGEILPETPTSSAFIPILLVLLFFSFTFVIVNGKKVILETINDFFYLKERSSIFIESNASQFKLGLNLILLFACSFGIFLYVSFFGRPVVLEFEHSISYLFFYIALSLAFLLLKYLLFRFLGYVFLDKSATDFFIRSYFTILFAYALALFPLVVLHLYAPANFHIFTLFAAILISILAVLLIFLKTSQIFLSNIVTFFYIILYLCTLEILPIFIVLKALT